MTFLWVEEEDYGEEQTFRPQRPQTMDEKRYIHLRQVWDLWTSGITVEDLLIPRWTREYPPLSGSAPHLMVQSIHPERLPVTHVCHPLCPRIAEQNHLMTDQKEAPVEIQT